MNSPPFHSPNQMKVDDAPANRICLLVLGMHRSGTSALTRVLSIAGAKLPATLMGANASNELGHWESDALVAYHDRLLEQLNSTWRDWRGLDFHVLPIHRRRDIKAEIANVITVEYGDAPLFVVKDPRICRFASLFLDAVAEAGIEPRVVQVFRHPLEVAGSLARRDGIQRTDASLLWLRHVLDSEAATRSRNRVVVSYAALLDDWRTTLARLTDTLRITWPYSADEIAGQVSQFLEASSRHHTCSNEDALLDPALRGWVGETYSAMLILERNPQSPAAIAALDAIRREFSHAAPILHMLQLEAHAHADENIAKLKAQIDEITHRADRLSDLLVEHEHEGTQLQAALSEAKNKASELEHALEQRTGQLKELGDKLAKREKELQTALSEARNKASELEHALEQRTGQLKELGDKLAKREKEWVRVRDALTEAENRAAILSASLEIRIAEAQSHAATVEALDGRIVVLQHEKDVLAHELHSGREALIAHIRNSTSWRVTAPIRGGPGCLNRFSAFVSGASAGVRLPSGSAAG